MRPATTTILLASALAASACGPSENDPGRGGVTVGEERTLDEAAEMLDSRGGPEGREPGEDGEDAAPVPPPAE